MRKEEVTWFCDVCKKQIPPPEYVGTIHIEEDVYDLCKECMLSFADWKRRRFKESNADRFGSDHGRDHGRDIITRKG